MALDNKENIVIKIEIQYKEKICQSKKILTDTEINNCISGVDNLLYNILSEMKNDIIKGFLDSFVEYGKESDAKEESD